MDLSFAEQAGLLIITGLAGGGVVGWITSRSVVAKNLSEAAGELVDAYGQRLKEVEQETKSLRAYIRRQGRYVRYLLDGINVLHAQAERHGERPDWAPEDIDVVCPPENDAA